MWGAFPVRFLCPFGCDATGTGGFVEDFSLFLSDALRWLMRRRCGHSPQHRSQGQKGHGDRFRCPAPNDMIKQWQIRSDSAGAQESGRQREAMDAGDRRYAKQRW
uniref:Uncharacterized protein n=1 Tax=Anopheles culicifacies TaxID=139723 RepID=A0A182LZS2_9DIPT